ncbi:MAG: sigma 54-interacting transcriptional regulator [Planctomycetes bacterium]|nr:sigma 54-interacting transcriptional regulator [Planctomycetota bacterium]
MDLAKLQAISLRVAALHSTEEVLTQMVEGLAAECSVSLARLWLVDRGDRCDTCCFQGECADPTSCLHLVASAGHSTIGAEPELRKLDGDFARYPIGAKKVGKVAETGEAVLLDIDRSDPDWSACPVWLELEDVKVFAGQPLLFRGEVLGVLAVFSREAIPRESFDWLRVFADQAAVAIANARAFETVDQLRQELELERDYLREEVKEARTFGGMVGESPALQNIARQIAMVAPTEASVLIQGESGTGKELIANAIHEQSARSARAMVRVNCASIPRELFESEFFGHAKGAFTGAHEARAGRFQVADGSTLFLDEVGEIPLELQGKLLRVLQEGQFSRVGEDKVRSVDVRVIAATNRDLRAEVKAGRFREDLYFRLSVFPLFVPPLRERRGDIAILAQHFLAQAKARGADAHLALRKRDVELLGAYDWPGNVRELQNVVERAVILAQGGRLHFELEPAAAAVSDVVAAAERVLTDAEVRALEKRNLQAALEASGWKVGGAGGAAELLDLKPTTLASRMKAFGITKPHAKA